MNIRLVYARSLETRLQMNDITVFKLRQYIDLFIYSTYQLTYMLIPYISDKLLSDNIGHVDVLVRLYSLPNINNGNLK